MSEIFNGVKQVLLRNSKFVIRYSSVLFLLVGFAEAKAEEIRRPNMIFILTDDQRHDAMGFMGA